MPFRVQDILLVSSLYDSFTLQEDGRLNELILSEFLDLNLHHTPGITHVSSGAEALALARAQPRFNLIVTDHPDRRHGRDRAGARGARRRARRAGRGAGLRQPRAQGLRRARRHRRASSAASCGRATRASCSRSSSTIEDQRNVAHDTRTTGVRVILLVEDNIRYYSSFLPTIYTELIRQSRAR